MKKRVSPDAGKKMRRMRKEVGNRFCECCVVNTTWRWKFSISVRSRDLIRKWVEKHIGTNKKTPIRPLNRCHRIATRISPKNIHLGPQQTVLTRCETITKNTLQTSTLSVSMDIHTNFERSCLLFHERCNNTEQQFISERVTRFVLCNGM